MSGPFQTNATRDIYRNGNGPPAARDVAGVAIMLQPDFAHAHGHVLAWSLGGQLIPLRWAHVALMPPDADVRDGYIASPAAGQAPSGRDRCRVPDRNGTRFDVVLVERIGRGSGQDLLRAYLVRGSPARPTSQPGRPPTRRPARRVSLPCPRNRRAVASTAASSPLDRP